MLDKIISAFDTKAELDCIYLDFKKAFDSVPHNELLVKLWQSGICGSLWGWFKAYLSTRQQCVSLSGVSSDLLPVVSGVPQGSILGPLLFIIYVNDLPSLASSADILMFADDTKCLNQYNTPLDSLHLQCDIDLISNWSNEWNLATLQ